MKTYAHGDQKFWNYHHPDYRDWRKCLLPGDEVKVVRKRNGNPSIVTYTLVRFTWQRPPGIPHFVAAGVQFAIVINTKGRETPFDVHQLVPINRVKPCPEPISTS